MPSDTDGAALVRRLYDAINRNAHDELTQLLAPGMVRHDLTDLIASAEGSGAVSDFLGTLREAMPDLRMALDDVFATDDDRAAARATLTGTHRGDFLGVPASGKRVTFAAITLYRIEAGRIAEAWSLVDWAGARDQMRAGK
jgi:steroid delta-isomerase-like uncharacterized protein